MNGLREDRPWTQRWLKNNRNISIGTRSNQQIAEGLQHPLPSPLLSGENPGRELVQLP